MTTLSPSLSTTVEAHAVATTRRREPAPTVLEMSGLNVRYGSFLAVRDVNLTVTEREITALIGPSGCGKSTVLRTCNRMNDLVHGASVSGSVTYHGQDIYASTVDPIEVRRHIGMVFQKPNPFPKSIYDNVAYGPRVNGVKLSKSQLDDVVEEALRGAALWGEVKHKLKGSALALSGGQQQRLCIARTISVKPEVILADEPCSALDPIATSRIEELLLALAETYTIVIVTHNMQQAARISDRTAFFSAELDEAGERYGELVEADETATIFSSPSDSRTADYIAGRFG